ncbi:hypothetical protein LOD99_15545 [Oopsacas minuta]|uniref:Uncharacterized protein n=1 Tax=Oopsacas minuta TaxID=111878 RepID=A0AAV7KD62_9METZ|nr:hypothetical protein LOD99_15540 [Oopsacas minuta]KAI6658276.1 hypothetical protein LOD99_15545 [Oopsacas minuta]
MVWREPKNHHDDCYFCMVNMSGWNRQKKNSWQCPDIDSAREPIRDCSKIQVPVLPSLLDTAFIEAIDESSDSPYCSNSCNELLQISKAEHFIQGQLNDLVRDLGLSKDASEILASRLSEHNIHSEVRIAYSRSRDEELIRDYSEESDFVFCNNIPGLLLAMGLSQYNPNEWRLFIDSPKRSLECVLLHNGTSLPVSRSAIQ